MSKKYPYGKQSIDEADKEAVLNTLSADFITSGPKVADFEKALCEYTGAKYALALSSATAGLHLAMLVLNLKNTDEVITSPITFLASANAILYANAQVKFADIHENTANIDIKEIKKQYTTNTKAIIPVHFAGQSCDMEEIYKFAKEKNLFVIEDAAHAIGSEYKGTKVGSCKYSDITVFSFHPVKTITTGEGGAITTNDENLYRKLRALHSHGVYKEGEMQNSWEYEMRELGYNYRMTDIQASLGISQLQKLEKFKARRREIVEYYNKYLNLPHLIEEDFSCACFHLYPILIEKRKEFYFKAREEGLNLQVHYIPVHTQPYYKNLGFKQGDCPKAESYYEKTLSLPLYPALTDEDLKEIVQRIKRINKELLKDY